MDEIETWTKRNRPKERDKRNKRQRARKRKRKWLRKLDEEKMR